MKKIIKYNLIALLAMVFFVYSCNEDDFTGYSKLTTTNPTVTISGIQSGGYTLLEAETSYTFDVTLSEAQITRLHAPINLCPVRSITSDPQRENRP